LLSSLGLTKQTAQKASESARMSARSAPATMQSRLRPA
jgi:hypothetical protein